LKKEKGSGGERGGGGGIVAAAGSWRTGGVRVRLPCRLCRSRTAWKPHKKIHDFEGTNPKDDKNRWDSENNREEKRSSE